MKLNYKILAIILIIIFGLYYYIHSSTIYENMENNNNCPNMLLEKDGEIHLFNTKKAVVPGVNPIKFTSLEEYAEFVEWQEGQGIHCPTLFLQYTTDAQNNDMIQVKPSIFQNQGGLPNNPTVTLTTKKDKDNFFEKNKMQDATLNSTPDPNMKFNTGMYAGFDQQNQNIGNETVLDKMFHENTETSRNPMDTHWGGKEFTQSKIEAGDYKGREIYKYKEP